MKHGIGIRQAIRWQPNILNIFGKEQLEDNNRFIASVTPSWEIIPGLTARGRLSTDLTYNVIESKKLDRNPERIQTAGQLHRILWVEKLKYEIYYGDLMLMFDRTFAEKNTMLAQMPVGLPARKISTTHPWVPAAA